MKRSLRAFLRGLQKQLVLYHLNNCQDLHAINMLLPDHSQVLSELWSVITEHDIKIDVPYRWVGVYKRAPIP